MHNTHIPITTTTATQRRIIFTSSSGRFRPIHHVYLKRLGLLICLCGLFGVVSFAAAQPADDACPAIVNQALESVGEACAGLGRNQVCYGYNQVFAFGQDTLRLDSFARSGDVQPLNTIGSLTTMPLDTIENIWGVAVMSVQANLPDSLPGQNVTFVVFGDSSIEADPESAGDDLTAPMQAFRISTGIGEPACKEAPRDGILLQSPQGTKVNFRVNGLDVEIGSTVLLDVRGDEKVWVSTLEGEAKVTSEGVTQTALPGQKIVTIPGQIPSDPSPYANTDVSGVPVSLLPDPVVVPFIVDGKEGANGWIPSDFAVEAGKTYQITGSGTVNVYSTCTSDCEKYQFGVNGSESIGIAPSDYPMPSANLGALIARLGEDGEPFLVGEDITFTPEADGVLHFRINDHQLTEDNTGAFIVIVSPQA